MGLRQGTKGFFTGVFFALAALIVIAPLALAADDSGDDLLDLDSLGSFDQSAPAQTSGAFGGTSAIFSGNLLTKFAHDIRKDNDREFLLSSLSYASAKAAVTLSPTLAVTLEGLAEYMAETNYDDHQAEFEAYLWEGNARWKLGPVDLTLGQQHVAWGLADAVNPTNLINPNNFDRFLDVELGYNKLPAPMARVEWYMPKNFKLDVVVLPFFVPAKFSIVGQDVALFAHEFPLFMLLGQLRENPDFAYTEQLLGLWYPDWENDLQKLLDRQEFYDDRTMPLEDDITHAEGAARFSGRMRSLDFSMSYFYLWDDIPTLHVNPQFLELLDAFGRTPEGYSAIPNPTQIDPDILLEPFSIVYHRSHAVGADIGTTFGGLGLRAEGTFNFGKYTYTEMMGTRRKPLVTWVVNADYTFDYDVMLSAIFMSSSIINYESDLLMPPTYNLLMLLLRKPWMDEKLTTEIAAIYDLSFVEDDQWQKGELFGQDGMFSPYVTYAITDPLKISVGANILWGERFELLGMLKDNSRAFVSLGYDF